MIIQENCLDNLCLSLFTWDFLIIREDSNSTTNSSTIILKGRLFTDKYFLVVIEVNSTSTRDSLVHIKWTII